MMGTKARSGGGGFGRVALSSSPSSAGKRSWAAAAAVGVGLATLAGTLEARGRETRAAALAQTPLPESDGGSGSSSGSSRSTNDAFDGGSPRRRINSRPKKLAGHAHYEYVIVGSGTAAYTALEAIRQSNPHASVLQVIEDHQIARLDVDIEPESLSDVLQDVYNEWRRHITCRLDNDEQHKYVGRTPGVRKWSTRREGDANKERSSAVSLLVESPKEMTLNPEDKTIALSDGSMLSYDKCLLAPPGHPRELYVLRSSISYTLQDKINALRDIQDFQDLSSAVDRGGQKILVVGGGFLGTSITSALLQRNQSLGKNKNHISQTFVESTPLQQYFPAYLAKHVISKLKQAGLDIRPDRLVTSVARNEVHDDLLETSGSSSGSESRPTGKGVQNDGSGSIEGTSEDGNEGEVQVTLMQGNYKEFFDADFVVLASTNVTPDTEIAKRSELEVDPKTNGIVVNSSLEAFDGLFVAGSAASYYDVSLGRRRVDTFDHSLNSGLLAGQNMVSEDARLRRYTHQPSFRCTLAGTGLTFEAVGEVNSNLATVGHWLSSRDEITGKPLPETTFERGIVYYVRENTVVGVLCCNASECVDVARDVLRAKTSVKEATKLLMLAPDPWIQVFQTK